MEIPDEYSRYKMFKIKYLGSGKYSIRSMLKSDMGWTNVNNELVITTIGTNDTAIPNSAKWTINSNTNGYAFFNSGKAVTSSDEPGDDVYLDTHSSSNMLQRWDMTEIEVTSAYNGVVIYNSVSSLAVGEQSTFNAGVYSAYTDVNGQHPITWSVTNGTGSATINAATGVLTAQSTGTVTVMATCGRLNKSTIRTINVTKLLIYQTESTYYYDESGIYAEDLTYADMSTDELRALDWLNWTDFVGYTPASHRSSWENMVVTLFSTGSLQTVALDMINHFMIGSGSNYTNAALTAAIKTHSSTQAYISAVENKIKQLMNEFDGDIASLLYEVETRNQNPLIIEMKADNIMQPVYNTSSDRTNGLTICVDSLWGNKIEVTSYVVSESTYTCTLHYTLYDHFGLDQNDVENYGYLNGFRSWYILQHYADYNGNYKPFVTLMEFDVTFSGTIS